MRLANFNKPLGADNAPFGFNRHFAEDSSWWSDNLTFLILEKIQKKDQEQIQQSHSLI